MSRFLARILALLILTAAMLEVALQLAFSALPPDLIQRMPQYQERSGFRLNAAHGAREYPARQSVAAGVTAASGDLFRLTCLSATRADDFEPYTVAYVRDAHGFRNPDPWRDDIELAVIGDSFTAAEMISVPFWQGLSEATLSLGLPGSGTLEQIRLLRAFALPRQPETVVLAYFAGNDMRDNLRFAEMQRDSKSWSDALHENRSPLDYLVSAHLAMFLRDSLLKSVADNCHYPQLAHTDPPLPVAFFDDMLPQLALDETELRESDMFQLTRAAVVEIARELKTRGIRFVFLYIPQKAELYWRYLDASAQSSIAHALADAGPAVTADAIALKLSAQRYLWHEVAAEIGFELLDLTPPLAAAIAAGQSPYFFGDTHWNQLGHDIAHQALRESLK